MSAAASCCCGNDPCQPSQLAGRQVPGGGCSAARRMGCSRQAAIGVGAIVMGAIAAYQLDPQAARLPSRRRRQARRCSRRAGRPCIHFGPLLLLVLLLLLLHMREPGGAAAAPGAAQPQCHGLLQGQERGMTRRALVGLRPRVLLAIALGCLHNAPWARCGCHQQRRGGARERRGHGRGARRPQRRR